jgi:hypothetical protein
MGCLERATEVLWAAFLPHLGHKQRRNLERSPFYCLGLAICGNYGLDGVVKTAKQVESRLAEMKEQYRHLKKKDGIGTANEIMENTRKMYVQEFVIFNLIWVLKD